MVATQAGRWFVGCIAVLGLLAAGCGDNGGGQTPVPGSPAATYGCDQPAGTVPLAFTVDDSANQTYDATDNLQWKGSFSYDAATNTIAHDASWAGGLGPYVPLVDDGPCDAGGSEPIGATAGDHIWSALVFADRTDATYQYGATRDTDVWIWDKDNGTVSTAADDDPATLIVASGLTIEAFGDTDLRIQFDESQIDAGFGSVAASVAVKASAWNWTEVAMTDGGSGVYTFELGVQTGTAFKHVGLLRAGDTVDFVLVIDGVEYRALDSAALTAGVTADYQGPTDGTTWQPLTVQVHPTADQYAYVTLPP